MNKTKLAIALGTVLTTASFGAHAANISWTDGLIQISGSLLVDQTGATGVGVINQITNLTTNGILYDINNPGPSPSFLSFNYQNSVATGATLIGNTLIVTNTGGSLTFYNNTVDEWNNLLAAGSTAAGVALTQTGSVWLDGNLPSTYTASFGGYNAACGNTMDPNCYNSQTGGNAYNWTTNNTGVNFVNPMAYTLSVNNLDSNTSAGNSPAPWRWEGISGNNVIGTTIPNAPEPETLALVGIGLLGMAFSRRKKA